jgi:NAD-dependent dihydropyrimidine dehydrogenase PreA subunit
METDIAWLPQIDEALCTGCGDCIIVCPTDVLVLADEIAILAKPDACNYCGACETVCPVGAIVLPYQISLAPGV